jgi:hypothetical protein
MQFSTFFIRHKKFRCALPAASDGQSRTQTLYAYPVIFSRQSFSKSVIPKCTAAAYFQEERKQQNNSFLLAQLSTRR